MRNPNRRRQKIHWTKATAWTTPSTENPPPAASPLPLPTQNPKSATLKKPQVWRDWIETSTIHGILDFHRPAYGKCWQISWLIVMVSFTAMALFSIEEVINEYISNPTIQNYQEKAATTFPLPDVSICTIQMLNNTVLEEMGASQSLIHGLKTQMNFFDPTSVINKCEQIDISQEYDDFRANNSNITYDQLLRRAGFKCEKIVKGCSWGQPCCDRATQFLDGIYGKCYRFNTAKRFSEEYNLTFDQVYPGPGAGVQMALSTSFAESEGTSSHTKGILVEFIYPNEPALFNYYQLQPGVIASAQLTLQVTERINLIGRPQTCEKMSLDGPLYDSEGHYNFSKLQKSSSGCFYVTYSVAMQKYCNCGSIRNVVEIPLCEPFDPCPNSNLDIAIDSAKLQAKCRPPCLRRSYSASITYSKFDTNAFIRRANNCCSEGISDDDLILLDVYHPQMEYLKVTEVEVYSAMTLLSNIGGAIGLWLGTSLMSIIQLIFFFVKWITTRK